MIRKPFSLLWVATVMCAAPLGVRAQAPGLANPQALPRVPPVNGGMGPEQRADPALPAPLIPHVAPQEKRKDDNAWWIHLMPHGIGHVAESAETSKSPRTPGAPFPEPMASLPEFRPTGPAVTPVPEFRLPAHEFPAIGEAGSSVSRGFSRWGGRGLLTGIGAAIAAAFGALFGKKEDS